MSGHIRIGERLVGAREPCYVIAEAGVNHDGDLEAARSLVRMAAESGADAVKFQLFRAADVASPDAPKAAYQLALTDPGESQVAMLEKLELPEDAFEDLARACKESGVDFLCTAYSEHGIDVLEDLGVAAFKIASAQIVELQLIARAASKGRPLLVSTGMATLNEIDAALATARENGDPPVVLLQCTTNYPSRLEEANVLVIPSLAEKYDVPVGYSDHTIGYAAAIAAVACGAAIVEKHVTLDRTRPGPDHSSSMESEELAKLIACIRDVEAALGSDVKAPTPQELRNAFAMRRSLFAIDRIPAGSTIAPHQVALRRPASGLPPSAVTRVVGARALADIPANTPITADLLGP